VEDEGQRLVLSAACTHPACGDVVSYDAATGTFHCWCGARYDRTGQAIAGPPTRPLAQFAARVVDDVA
jgi:Rieske Fe-S protein